MGKKKTYLLALLMLCMPGIAFGGIGFSGAIEASHFAYPYEGYGPSMVLKGVNFGILAGLNEEFYLRGNLGFAMGGYSELADLTPADGPKTELKYSGIGLPFEVYSLYLIPAGKLGHIYPGFGVGFYFWSTSGERISGTNTDELTSYTTMGIGFPLILGIEKEVFPRIRFFGEYSKLFWGSMKVKWDEKDADGKVISHNSKDIDLSSFGSFGGLGKIRMGLMLIF